MALQFIVSGVGEPIVREKLHAIDKHIEVFLIDDLGVGISVPAKVIDQIGEEQIRGALASFGYYDLWSGERMQKEKGKMGLIAKIFGKV